MITTLWHTLVYDPLYNALIFLIHIVPHADVGIAVIILTVFVKTLLFPLAHRVAKTQVIMKRIQPKLDALKKDFKDNKQEQTLKTLALYKEYNINPFFGFLVILIQLPIILGLYFVFYKGGLPVVNVDILYNFVSHTVVPNMTFIGIADMAGKSVVLAFLAGATQFIQMQIVMPSTPKPKDGEKPSMKDDLTRSMHMQMKYVMPIIITVVAYTISAAVALYWVTSNLFAIGQELFVRRSMKGEE